MESTKWLRLYVSCTRCGVLTIYKHRTICEHCNEAHCYLDKISHKKNCKGLQLVDSKTLTNGPDFSKVSSKKTWLLQKVDSEGSIMSCPHCDKKCLGTPFACHKCRSVFYCSKACLEIDQPSHSSTCETAALFHYVHDGLFHGQTYQILKKKGLIDGREISPFLDSIHYEFHAHPYDDPLAERAVVILQISAPYPQSWQFAILVRDIRGKAIHLIFYHDETTKASMTGGPHLEPYNVAMVPLADCLKPGNFIILLDPWFHIFEDMTHGIRIDTLEKVHFVWKEGV